MIFHFLIAIDLLASFELILGHALYSNEKNILTLEKEEYHGKFKGFTITYWRLCGWN